MLYATLLLAVGKLAMGDASLWQWTEFLHCTAHASACTLPFTECGAAALVNTTHRIILQHAQGFNVAPCIHH